jgi:hypothetical protein
VPLLPDWRAVEAAWPNLTDIRAKLSRGKPFAGDVCVISGTNSIKFDPQSKEILYRSMLRELCLGDSSGLFSLVSQVSPTGGQNFEDVRDLDAQNGGLVLAIVTRVGDDIIVYRRFFHGN